MAALQGLHKQWLPARKIVQDAIDRRFEVRCGGVERSMEKESSENARATSKEEIERKKERERERERERKL